MQLQPRFLALSPLVTAVSTPFPLKFSAPLRVPQALAQNLLDAQKNDLAQSDWKEFSSPAGNFTVLVPARLTNTNISVKGVPVEFVYKFTSENSIYLVKCFDIPGTAKVSSDEFKKFFYAALSDLVKAPDAKLLAERSISMTGHPGREFEFASNGITGKGRVSLVERRLYAVVAVTPQLENAQKFLDSFHLLTLH